MASILSVHTAQSLVYDMENPQPQRTTDVRVCQETFFKFQHWISMSLSPMFTKRQKEVVLCKLSMDGFD